MPWKYNPFTDALDQTGSGGASYINGVVADPTALPVTLGTPALDSVYLAKAGSGVWLINRKPAGLYCRVANNGNANDWVHLGAFPEVNADGNWELYNSADPTKELKFDLSGIATGTTRTITVPNKNVTLDDASDARTPTAHNHAASAITSGVFDNARINFAAPSAIGSTTRNTGAFTTLSATPAAGSTALTLTGGTVTASVPVMSVTQTWNNAAGSFTTAEMRTSVTAGNGYLFRIFAGSTGTTERFRVAADGEVNAGVTLTVAGPSGGIGSPNFSIGNSNHWRSGSNGALVWTDTANNAYAGTNDLFVLRDAAGTLAQRNAANPQIFRLYNTTDAGLTNYERASLGWVSNRFSMIVEAAGTGTARGALLRVGTGQSIILDADTHEFRSAGFTQRLVINSSGVTVHASLLLFNGTTSSFPALKRSSTTLQVRLADDSGYTVLDAQLRAQGTAPATSGATGTAGDIRYDADYIYVCTAANTWKRAAIATW